MNSQFTGRHFFAKQGDGGFPEVPQGRSLKPLEFDNGKRPGLGGGSGSEGAHLDLVAHLRHFQRGRNHGGLHPRRQRIGTFAAGRVRSKGDDGQKEEGAAVEGSTHGGRIV